MNKKKVIATLLLAAAMIIAGCGDAGDAAGGDKSQEIANDTGVDINNKPGPSYWYEVSITEGNQINLVKERPPFQMDDSLERQNLIERYKYLNDQNNQHHVYALSNDGKVVLYSVAQGKVSSVNSKLTNDIQIVADERCLETTRGDSEGSCFFPVESPQMDGSYGTNGDAIFWFTPEGDYVEYNGKYVVSEEPKNIQTKVTLVDMVDDNETDG